jgi:hypothetical protein
MNAQRWLRNTKWILPGTFTPDSVVLLAWKQWLSAKSMSMRKIKVLLEEYAQQKQGGPDCDCSVARDCVQSINSRVDKFQGYTSDKAVAATTGKTLWNFMHSMYASMGGFVFEMDLLRQGDPQSGQTYSGRPRTPPPSLWTFTNHQSAGPRR